MPGKTYAEIVSDEIRAAGYSVGVVGYIDLRTGRVMYAADAHKDDGHRWIARAETELKAWIALKAMLWEARGLSKAEKNYANEKCSNMDTRPVRGGVGICL